MPKRKCDQCGRTDRDTSWPGAKIFDCGHFACSECGKKYSKCQVAGCR